LEFVIFYNPKGENRVAFVAGKKVGNAVARNKAKRILRAHFVELSSQLNNGTYLFVAKSKLLECSYEVRNNSLRSALKKLNALQINVRGKSIG